MLFSVNFVLGVVALISISGCTTAMQLQDANEQLISYYYAKEQASDNPAMEETAIASLRDLARETAKRANSEKDPLNKISFYRIAATAAWQARDNKVLEYTEAGNAACIDNWSTAPRDCGMLTFIDDLAAVDETTRRFNELRHSGDPSVNDVVAVFNAYEESAFTMIENRSQLLPNVPASLLAAYDKRLDDLICSKIGLGAIGLAATADANLDGACRLGNIRLQARQVDLVLPSCTGAIPTTISECE